MHRRFLIPLPGGLAAGPAPAPESWPDPKIKPASHLQPASRKPV